MRLTLITLAFVLLVLTACNDPLGYVQAEQIRANAQVQTAQIQADAQTEQARIDASTARVRVGGWMVAAMIGGVVAVAIAGIGALTHLQAQRDRLTAEQWRNRLPAAPTALPTTRTPAGHWLALRRAQPMAPTTLALPARSESGRDVIVIDR